MASSFAMVVATPRAYGTLFAIRDMTLSGCSVVAKIRNDVLATIK